MKKLVSLALSLLLVCGLVLNCTGCALLFLADAVLGDEEPSSSQSASSGTVPLPTPTVETDDADDDVRGFYTDTANARSVTVMLYMIGSDLESDDGSATDDLEEILSASQSENLHIVLQTGGTETWWNTVCTDGKCERFSAENGDLTRLEDLDSVNMTDADTLSDFIRFSAEAYPADRYELILWDHGGGTMTGFGYDELYEDTSLTLSDLSTALYNGGVQFDFIGFDACLMATSEIAYTMEPFADYLIASEESEPGEGWYYVNWLSALAQNPAISTKELAKTLTNDFLDTYTLADTPTLSVLDLRYAGKLYNALENYWKSACEALLDGRYADVSQLRSSVHEFGESEYDQVDLADLVSLSAQKLALGTEKDVQTVLEKSVVCSVSYQNAVGGVAVYFPCLWPDYYNSTRFEMSCVGFTDSYFAFYDKFISTMLSGQSLSGEELRQYASYDWFEAPGEDSETPGGNLIDEELELIDKGDYYALSLTDDAWDLITYIEMSVYLDDGEGYIDLGSDNVYEFDDDGDLKVDFDYTWISIDDVIVPFYAETEEQADDYWFTSGYVPAILNGETEIEIILCWDSEHKGGYVSGYRLKTEEPAVAAKGLHSFKETDKIQYTCSYYDYDFQYDSDYTLGEAVSYSGEPSIAYEELDDYRAIIMYTLRDIYNNEHYTTPVVLKFSD